MGELIAGIIVAVVLGIVVLALSNADVRGFFQTYFENGIPKY